MFPLPLLITVAPSRRLRLLVAGLHLAAAGALWLADLPMAAQLASTGLIGASLAAYRRPGQPVTLRAKSRGELEIREGDAWKPVPAFSAQLLFPAITLLRYTPAGQDRPAYLAILPDSLPAQDFRRLRVWLRWLGDRRGSKPADADPTAS